MNQLARQLGLGDAIVIGLAAMIGSGIFVAFSPAALVAQNAIFLSLFLASLVAFLNALTMSKLAVKYPLSGGTYVYGREILGPYWGYLAGSSFVVGKIASCTAMAYAVGTYLTPETPKITAIICIISVTVINILGIKKTALVSKIILMIVVISLITTATGLILNSSFVAPTILPMTKDIHWSSLLQGAAILFFAFAGYARVATLGEEVYSPEKTIPKAITISLALTIALYFIVAFGVFGTLNILDISNSTAPLADAVKQNSPEWLLKMIIFAATVACYGVLLSLSAGVSRTIYAMAGNGDLPQFLTKVGATKTPIFAEITVGLFVMSVISQTNLLKAISFSSFSILLYYSLSHLSVLKMLTTDRRRNLRLKGQTLLGLILTISLSFSLSSDTILKSLITLTILSLIYQVTQLMRPPHGS
jgi:APA family basic amino acid/polyamine antiporter